MSRTSTLGPGGEAAQPQRYRRFLKGVSQDEGLALSEMFNSLARYSESVRVLLMASYEDGERAGFEDSFLLIEIAERLGCQDMAVIEPERADPIEMRLRRIDGAAVTICVARDALSLDRLHLTDIVVQELQGQEGEMLGTSPAESEPGDD